jgi:hypothetical protein
MQDERHQVAHSTPPDQTIAKTAHNLQLHRFSLKLDSPDLEIDTNSADVALGVCVICKTQQKAGLR